MDVPLSNPSRNGLLLRLAASLLLGSALPLAFAPFSLSPLAVLIPAVLLWVLQFETSLRRLFLSGWIFGIGYFGFGVYWIYNSLHDFGMAPPAVAVAITALLVVYLALTPALILSFCGYAQRHIGRVGLWLLPLFWFALEWFKGWFLTGMPWLSLGYSQTQTPLAGFAPLIGVYGISAICMLMSVALYRLVRERRVSMLAVLLALPTLGWMFGQMDWTQAHGTALKVTLVQGNIPQELKWRRDQEQNTVNTYWRETNEHWDSDLIVWPETALPGYSEEIEQSILAPLQRAASAQGSVIITGLLVSDSTREQIFNSVVKLDAQRQFYHKRHLVLFGEYYPMRWLLDLLSTVINIPHSDLTAGPTQQDLMQVGDVLLGVSICFEAVFSRDIQLALPAANLLVNLSNDAWFGRSTAAHQHLQIAQMRSLESERAMMRATNTGISAFIDRKGRITAKTRQYTTESITASLQGRSGNTPFYYFAKLQGWLAPLPFIFLLLWIRRRAG